MPMEFDIPTGRFFTLPRHGSRMIIFAPAGQKPFEKDGDVLVLEFRSGTPPETVGEISSLLNTYGLKLSIKNTA